MHEWGILKMTLRIGLVKRMFLHIWIDTGLGMVGFDIYLKQKREYESDENRQYFKAITVNGKSRYDDIGFINVYAEQLIGDFRADYDIDDLADFKKLYKRISKVYERATALQDAFLRARENNIRDRVETVEVIREIESKTGYPSRMFVTCFSLQKFYDFEETSLLKIVPKLGVGIYTDWGNDMVEYFRISISNK
jgi:hypothetical protein